MKERVNIVFPSNPYEKYKKSSIESISPGEVIVKLFEGCYKFLETAKGEILNGNKLEANKNIVKAEDILAELMDALDFEYDISNQLYIMYNYMYTELVKITINQNVESLEKIIDMVHKYAETWKEANKIDRIEKHSYRSDRSYI